MEDRHDVYEEALVRRYASPEMNHIFSDNFKFPSWRRCWTALAEAEMELGMDIITPQMINELVASQETIDYSIADTEERRRRHDVMAHVHEYGTHCPNAAGIIHLGATSMLVCDNTEIIQQRDAMNLVKRGLVNFIDNLVGITEDTKGLACLAYTHLQPAQPTTMGKRFTDYIQNGLMDLDAIEGLRFMGLGAKGTTGTQESFMKLFGGDHSKVKALDELFAKKLGFNGVYPVSTQTYPRKFDVQVAQVLAGIGVSLYKFAQDMRILSHDKCLDEPFRKEQIGSSAMAYKRNPMRCERIGGLANDLMGIPAGFQRMASSQMLERTLDDSAYRRRNIPIEFLLTDAILVLANDITNRHVDTTKGSPLTFYPAVIRRLLNDEIQFMSTEEILMDLVNKGQDRQVMHEVIRRNSQEASNAIKDQGKSNDLFERLSNDPEFPSHLVELRSYIDNSLRFCGRALEQTEEYLEGTVKPKLRQYKDLIGQTKGEVKV